MNCRSTRRLASAYEDNELTLKQRMRINSHVLACQACREFLSAFQKREEALRAAFSEPLHAPRGLAEAVEGRLERECPVRSEPRLAGLAWRKPLWGASGSMLLAGAAAWALFFVNGVTRTATSWVPKAPRAASPTEVAAAPSPLEGIPGLSLPSTPTGPDADPDAAPGALQAEWRRLGRFWRGFAPVPQGTPGARVTPPALPDATEASPEGAHPAGRVRQVDGTLMVAQGTQGWQPVTADFPLQEDHSFRTGEDSLVAFELKGGIEIRVNADTEVMPVKVPGGPGESWELKLVRGELWAKVPGEDYGLEVVTASGRAIARDGEMYVHAVTNTSTTATEMLVLKGEAMLTNDFDLEPQWARSGTEAVVRLDERPTQPTVFAPERKNQLRWAYAPIQRRDRQSSSSHSPSSRSV